MQFGLIDGPAQDLLPPLVDANRPALTLANIADVERASPRSPLAPADVDGPLRHDPLQLLAILGVPLALGDSGVVPLSRLEDVAWRDALAPGAVLGVNDGRAPVLLAAMPPRRGPLPPSYPEIHVPERGGPRGDFGGGGPIYRGGGSNAGNLQARPGKDPDGLSFRDSLSNPYPKGEGQPPLRPGKEYIEVDPSRLHRGP
jgi:hypothetical protein